MTGNDIFMVAIGCRNAHLILDNKMDHAQMEEAVLRAIENGGGVLVPEGK